MKLQSMLGYGIQYLLVLSCVEKREWSHVLRKALDFEVEGQSKKGRLKKTWKI